MRDLHAFLQLQKKGDPVLECDNFAVDDEGSGLLPWIAPMLATLTDERFSRQGWLFEPKWDGERCLAFRRGGDVRLFSQPIQYRCNLRIFVVERYSIARVQQFRRSWLG